MKQFHDLVEAKTLALAIVDTLPEPFLVLDEKLQLLAGSRCFYEIYGEDPGQGARPARCSSFRAANGTFRVCAGCSRR